MSQTTLQWPTNRHNSCQHIEKTWNTFSGLLIHPMKPIAEPLKMIFKHDFLYPVSKLGPMGQNQNLQIFPALFSLQQSLYDDSHAQVDDEHVRENHVDLWCAHVERFAHTSPCPTFSTLDSRPDSRSLRIAFENGCESQCRVKPWAVISVKVIDMTKRG